MVARVLIKGGVAPAMRVSLPGFNVNTASIDQTCFDSRWSGLTPLAAGTLTTSNDVQVSAPFTPQPVPPLVLCHSMEMTVGGVPAVAYETTPNMSQTTAGTPSTHFWWYVFADTANIYFRAVYATITFRLTYVLLKRTSETG